MALTLDAFKRTVFGNKRIVMCDCDFDTVYPTGGESLTPTNLGFANIEFLLAEPHSGLVFEYDYTNQLLKAYRIGIIADAGTAGADNTIIKSAGGVLEVAGAGTAFQLALAEVANATDLSAVTNVRIFAVGTGLK